MKNEIIGTTPKIVSKLNNQRNLKIIIDAVCLFFDLSVAEIGGKSRERKYIEPRQVFHYFAKYLTKANLTEIGLFFKTEYNLAKFDHSTVLNSVKAINNLYDTDKEWRNKIITMEVFLRENLKESAKEESLLVSKIKDISERVLKCETRYELNKFLYNQIVL